MSFEPAENMTAIGAIGTWQGVTPLGRRHPEREVIAETVHGRQVWKRAFDKNRVRSEGGVVTCSDIDPYPIFIELTI